jgi:DNA-directed RNA polymerase subunit RPC12/RpoP
LRVACVNIEGNLKGGEGLNTLKGRFGKVLCLGVFVCMVALVSCQFNIARAEKGGPCPKKVNELLYWCTECNEIFTWNECGNLKYIWDTKEHKAGEEVATHKMVKSWSCIRTRYNCVNDKCENSKACYAFNIGFCEVCNDDLTGTAIRAKLNFKCTKCGKEFDEAGPGHEIDHKKEYAEHLLTFGKCGDCGEALDTLCKQSGTCPHEPDF